MGLGGTVNHLQRLREELCRRGLEGMLVPSTDEYLSEFTRPFTRRLKWVTGFRGSTGLGIVLQERAALFVDGRYQTQARLESGPVGFDICDLTPSVVIDWLTRSVPAGAQIALDTRLQSYPEVRRLLSATAIQGLSVTDVSDNPIDCVWGAERPGPPMSAAIDYPPQFAGYSSEEKIERACAWLRRERYDCYMLADPEDVAWLLNVRTNDSLVSADDGWHTVPVCLSRAVVDVAGLVIWFVDASRLDSSLVDRLGPKVRYLPEREFEQFVHGHFYGKHVCANLQRTPYRFAALAERVGSIADAPEIARWRWRKHPTEIECARAGHFRDGQAVVRFIAWLKTQVAHRVRVTEVEAARKLTELRGELPGFQGISMPVMSSSGASGSLPHYIPGPDSNRVVNDHPVYWVDSGAQFYGCSTDNTVCIAVGKPESRHILAHTLVVKGYIALASARFPDGIASTQLDTLARQYLWREGMDYGHGTGHGVGNFMNIHEGPYIRKEIQHHLVAPLEEGMIISNEPGYYAAGDFGVRIESHLAVRASDIPSFLEFETISRLPIDPELIDQARLTPTEKVWLADYHAWIYEGYKDCLDESAVQWLRGVVDCYRQIALSKD